MDNDKEMPSTDKCLILHKPELSATCYCYLNMSLIKYLSL